MNLLALKEACWRSVPQRAVELYKAAKEIGLEAQSRLRGIPIDDIPMVGYDVGRELFVVDSPKFEAVQDQLHGLAPCEKYAEQTEFVPVLANPRLARRSKLAEDKGSVLSEWLGSGRKMLGLPAAPRYTSFDRAVNKALPLIGKATFALESPVSKYLPFTPSPVAHAIAGGLLGAATGYGAGWLGEKLLPETWERKKLRRSMMLLGAGLGAAPGLVGTGFHLANGVSPLAPGPLNDGWRVKDSSADGYGGGSDDPLAWRDLAYDPVISLQRFNNAVWNDPRVADRLAPPEQAALTGLVTGAAQQSPNPSPWVTPMDVANVAVGMGSGYLAGAIVGKALGTLMGMPESTQDRLKDTGMWAGVVKSLVPLAFGR